MNTDLGRVPSEPGSHEPSPDGLGPEAGETGTGSTEGNSADPKGIAK